jgi:hypothetical protein
MVQHLHFSSKTDADWQWPVKVALPESSASLESHLMQQKWPGKFVRLNKVPGITSLGRYNLLFFQDLPSPIDLALLNFIYADIVIILRSPQSAAADNAQFKELATRFHAVGVFYIEQDMATLANWFDNVIIQLSHNNDIVKSVEAASSSAILYYDKKLITQTTLAYFVVKLILKLKTAAWATRVFNIKTAYLGTFTGITGLAMAQLLETKQDYFNYLRESGDASDLLEISTAMPESYGNIIIGPYGIDRPYKKPGDDTGGFQDFGADIYKSKGSTGKGDKGYPPKNEAAGEEHKEYKPAKGTFKKFGKQSSKKEEKSEPIKKPTRSFIAKGAKKAGATEPSEAAPKDDARYLQAGIKSENNEAVEGALKPSQDYKLGVQIGSPKKGFIHTNTVFPSHLIFPYDDNTKANVQLVVKTNLHSEPLFAEIVLHRNSDSDTAYFKINTGDKQKEFIADIYAYHKNRRIQQIRFTAQISSRSQKGNSAQEIKSIFSARKSLGELDTRTEFAASIEIIPGEKKDAVVRGITNNSPLNLYADNGLKPQLLEMKAKIENALVPVENDTAEKATKRFNELLISLANRGSIIYTGHLRGKVAPEGPLQIISNDQSFLPVEFIYSYPPFEETATVCPKAKDALTKGVCCGDVKKDDDIGRHVCPFGFWLCSRIIERHNFLKRPNDGNAAYSIVSEPVKNRETLQILNNTLFGASVRVDISGEGLIKSMMDAIRAYKVKLEEAKDWDNWSVMIGQTVPDSMILVVHIEKDNKNGGYQIELGDNKFLPQRLIGPKVISRKHLNPPPFVVMLGCESTDLKNEGFDVASHFLNEGAAIVLSNFTRILGTHARDIVINLVKFLETEGKVTQSFGEIMLKLRRYLLSEGLVAGLILQAQGDADWKIKI